MYTNLVFEKNFFGLLWFNICVQSTATYIINDIAYTVKAGDIVYIPKSNYRCACTDSKKPIHCYAFNFQIDFMDGESIALPFPAVFHVGNDDYLISLFKQFNYAWLEKSKGYILKCRAIFMLILHHLMSIIFKNDTLSFSNKRIEKVKTYILGHYQTKTDMDQLASVVNINPVYLGAYFKKSTCYSIKEYITRIRINKAYDLLSTGEYSVSEIAYKCGFDDLFYFSKVFKKIIGMPPSQLLKS